MSPAYLQAPSPSPIALSLCDILCRVDDAHTQKNTRNVCTIRRGRTTSDYDGNCRSNSGQIMRTRRSHSCHSEWALMRTQTVGRISPRCSTCNTTCSRTRKPDHGYGGKLLYPVARIRLRNIAQKQSSTAVGSEFPIDFVQLLLPAPCPPATR